MARNENAIASQAAHTPSEYYVSLPQAFQGASGALPHFVKIGVAPVRSASGDVQLGRAYDHVLFDFRCLPKKIDFTKVRQDLESIRQRVEDHPREWEDLAQVFRDAAAPEGNFDQDRAQRALDALHLREAEFVQEGGGFLILIVLLVLGAAGCAGCNPFDGQPHPTTPVKLKGG